MLNNPKETSEKEKVKQIMKAMEIVPYGQQRENRIYKLAKYHRPLGN